MACVQFAVDDQRDAERGPRARRTCCPPRTSRCSPSPPPTSVDHPRPSLSVPPRVGDGGGVYAKPPAHQPSFDRPHALIRPAPRPALRAAVRRPAMTAARPARRSGRSRRAPPRRPEWRRLLSPRIAFERGSRAPARPWTWTSQSQDRVARLAALARGRRAPPGQLSTGDRAGVHGRRLPRSVACGRDSAPPARPRRRETPSSPRGRTGSPRT